jgi:hypothetical protein
MFIITFVNSTLPYYKKLNLLEKLKPTTQFIDLMLRGNIYDLLDPNRKKIQYS